MQWFVGGGTGCGYVGGGSASSFFATFLGEEGLFLETLLGCQTIGNLKSLSGALVLTPPRNLRQLGVSRVRSPSSRCAAFPWA